jgi:hypothetical protein
MLNFEGESTTKVAPTLSTE